MSFSRINFLKKVKAVCELHEKNKVEDVPASVTFRQFVEPIYPMHIITFYKYLGINYKKELKDLDKAQA